MQEDPVPATPSLPADPWPALLQRAAGGVVSVQTQRRDWAAGWVWQPGVVLTAASALWRSRRLSLVLADGSQIDAELRGADAGTDLALLVAAPTVRPAEGLPAAAQAPQVGAAVAALGREPSGLLQASFGRIGLVGPAWRTWRGGELAQRIRLDGGLYRGLNGAPVIDDHGALLGLASAALSRQHGVVLPLATIERVAAQLLAHGQVAQGYLGLGAQPVLLPARVAADSGEREGLLVSAVADDGPAAAAGVIVGDLLVQVAGQPVADLAALRQRLGGDSVGQPLELSLWRGGVGLRLTAQVAARPQPQRCG